MTREKLEDEVNGFAMLIGHAVIQRLNTLAVEIHRARQAEAEMPRPPREPVCQKNPDQSEIK